MKNDEQAFRALLRTAGLKVTSPRLAVLAYLQKSKKPLSVQDLLQLLRNEHSMDQATVYRITKQLAQKGLFRQVEFRHGHAYFEMLDAHDHHHHFVCDRCHRVLDIEIPDHDGIIKKLEKRYGFTARDHSIEFFGHCERCS